MPRASVSFPADLYEALERIAKEKKVSVAWVVREAVERYVDQRLAVSDK
ncbi:ribbon-helix-helix domain-containing protein [Lysobacter capsici]|nr:ribbon-helix-helix protein, CopG family [Lysobacter capsici]